MRWVLCVNAAPTKVKSHLKGSLLMSVSVGIDLGTTFCAVAYIDPKTKLPQIIPNSEGKKLTPSVIQFIDDEIILGSEAEDAFNAGEENCIATFKREMGEDAPCCYIGNRSYTSEDLSAMLLRHLKQEAEATLGDSIKEAVITVPAYFHSKEREATLRAAEKAGIKVKKLIDEPNAAAMAYGLNHWRENANILVYDLGGGTFDVTLVHMGKDGALSTITTRGDHKLGGRDWDARIRELLIAKFEDETGLTIQDNNELLFIVNGMSESVKKQLSAPNLQVANVIAFFPGYGKATVRLSKNEFEESTVDLLNRTGALCRSILQEASLTLKDVTDVLLVGGSTRMPQVSDYLKKMFGKPPLSHVNPDEAVALGAAIQVSKANESYAMLAILEVDGKKTTDRTKMGLTSHLSVKAEKKLGSLNMLTIRETTAHAMGVVSIDDENNRYYNQVIIPANHPRPVRAAKRFRFYEDKLDIYVLQGDNENPQDCQVTHRYVVTGIKQQKVGTVIRVQYSYDVNGIIQVQVRQEDENKDLPIKRENIPADIVAQFAQAVTSKKQGLMGKFLGIKKQNQNVLHKYKAITFSNVAWEIYDNVSVHEPPCAEEPTVHVIANEKNIEFHGYTVSRMDEGVRYFINPKDDFEIECDINTSTISPHPGGYLEISLGLISAQLTENGGDILLEGKTVATVKPRFHLKMSLTQGGQYEVAINGKVKGKKYQSSKEGVEICFGFIHDSHCCEELSHAYISDIEMKQSVGQDDDDNSDTDTWDD